jgi:hypothetical protein
MGHDGRPLQTGLSLPLWCGKPSRVCWLDVRHHGCARGANGVENRYVNANVGTKVEGGCCIAGDGDERSVFTGYSLPWTCYSSIIQ